MAAARSTTALSRCRRLAPSHHRLPPFPTAAAGAGRLALDPCAAPADLGCPAAAAAAAAAAGVPLPRRDASPSARLPPAQSQLSSATYCAETGCVEATASAARGHRGQRSGSATEHACGSEGGTGRQLHRSSRCGKPHAAWNCLLTGAVASPADSGGRAWHRQCNVPGAGGYRRRPRPHIRPQAVPQCPAAAIVNTKSTKCAESQRTEVPQCEMAPF